jgi:hypothetical protein
MATLVSFEVKNLIYTLMLEDGHSIPISFAPEQKPGILEIPGFLGLYCPPIPYPLSDS